MRVLLVAATPFELAPTTTWLCSVAAGQEENVLQFPRCEVEVIITGIGLTATAFALGHRFGAGPLPQLAVQAGVAGAYDPTLPLTEVVEVISEVFLDLGAENGEGKLLTLADIRLPPGPPFDERGRIVQPRESGLPYRRCNGGTANRATGSEVSIRRLRERFPEVEVESMEGAAFAYACAQAGTAWTQLRAISNYVEPRNRDNWRMGEAIQSLNQALRQLLGPFIS